MTVITIAPMETRNITGVGQTCPPVPRLVQLWLHGRPEGTADKYQESLARFLAFVGETPLPEITLGTLQAFADTMTDLAPSTKARHLYVCRDLFNFAHQIGVLPFNVAAALRVPKAPSTKAKRILSEEEVAKMIALEPNDRNRALLRLLYVTGLRAEELCGLTWGDMIAHGETGFLFIIGKGEKPREAPLEADTWQELLALRGDATLKEPVFRSRKKGGHLDPSQVWRIVRAAAKHAGIAKGVSPHWLRHASGSHALDRGAPVHFVRDRLGHASLATTSTYAHSTSKDALSRYLPIR